MVAMNSWTVSNREYISVSGSARSQSDGQAVRTTIGRGRDELYEKLSSKVPQI